MQFFSTPPSPVKTKLRLLFKLINQKIPSLLISLNYAKQLQENILMYVDPLFSRCLSPVSR